MSARPKLPAEAFLDYFDINLATTSEMREEVARIRYRVYCEEFAYEDGDAFPDGKEVDEFDNHAFHCLVMHKATKAAAGCVRVVKTHDDGILPFEKHCATSLDANFFNEKRISRSTMCEVSRLAVDKKFRRRAGEKATRYGGVHDTDLSQQEQRTFPLIAISCFLAATAVTKLSCHNNVFAMMEPFLPRLLARSGIEFEKIGYDIDYHGMRAPYYITTGAAVKKMSPHLKDLYRSLYDNIASDFAAI